MKKTKLFYLSLFTVLFILVFGVSVLADYEGTIGSVQWNVDVAGGKLTISGSGSIPAYENGKAPWSEHSNIVKEIEVTNGITSISIGAFYGMDYVETLTVPFVGGSTTSNTFLGYIFGANEYYGNNIYIPKFLKKVIVESSSSYTVPARAFNDCESLEEVVLGLNVSGVGDYAFAYCHSLKFVTIRRRSFSIGANAFLRTDALKNVFYAYTLNNWNSSSYVSGSGKSSVTPTIINGKSITVTAPAKTTYLLGEEFASDGIKVMFDGKDVTEDATIIYPDMSSIGEKTYKAVYGILEATGSVTVSATETSGISGAVTWSFNESSNTLTISGNGMMDDYTLEILAPWYKYRSNIKTLVVSEGVESVGDFAFYYLSELESVTLSNSVKTVGYAAFEGASKLNTFTATNANVVISSTAFRGCDALVYSDGTNEYYKIAGNNYYMLKKANSLTTFNEGTVVIGEGAFENASITNVTIPDTIKVIGDGAFKNSSVKTVTLGNDVKIIGNSAFENSALTTITFGVAPEFIGVSAFSGADDLTTMVYDNAEYLGSNANPYMVLLRATDSDITECTVHSSTVTIASLAFANTKELASVVLPDTLEYVGDSAFYGDSALYSINLPRSIKTIGASAFANCTSLAVVEIGTGVEKIGNSAFRGDVKLQSIAIPLTVKTIGYNAFRDCTSLTTVAISDGVKSIGYKTFDGCTSLENVYLPDSLYSIGEYAFKGATALKSLAIPFTTENIGFAAFANTGIENLALPFVGDGVSSDNAYLGYIFGGLSALDNSEKVPESLTTVVIGSNIPAKAFYGVELTNVFFDTTVNSIASDAFSSATVNKAYYLGTADEWSAVSGNTTVSSVTVLDKAFTVTPPAETNYSAGHVIDLSLFSAKVGTIDVLSLIRLNSNPIITVGNDVEIPVYFASLTSTFTASVVDDITITSFSLLLEGSIGVKAYVSLSPYAERNIDDITAKATYKGEEYIIPLISQNKGDDKVYYLKFNVAAKDMHEDIEFSIKSSTSSEVATITVVDYVDYVNENSAQFADTIDLVNAMYDFGEYSRKYFKGEEIDPKTDASELDVSITSVHKPIKAGSVTGLSIYSSSLLLESETTIRHYFKLAEGANIADYTFSLEDGTILVPETKDGYWYVDISNIPSHRLNKLRLLTVTKGSEIAKFLYSPLAYAKTVIERNSAKQIDLINALKSFYNYFVESKDYFDFINGVNVTPEENESEDQIW